MHVVFEFMAGFFEDFHFEDVRPIMGGRMGFWGCKLTAFLDIPLSDSLLFRLGFGRDLDLMTE